MDERDWLIITTLHHHKSITGAAKALYMSQPTLTTRMQQIEDSLGVTLIVRTSKGVTFTGAGERAAAFADKAIHDTRTFREEILNMGDEIAGVLRIAAPDILARHYLPHLLSKFQELHPKVKFAVTVEQSSNVVTLMNSRSLHFGFIRNDLGWNKEERLSLTMNTVCAVATRPFQLTDLPKMTRVDYTTDGYYRQFLDSWWKENFTDPPNIGMEVSSLGLCKEMVFAGLGYGILPSIVIEPGVSGLFCITLCHKDNKPLARKTYLIYKKEVMHTKLAETFYKFIEQCDFDSFLV